VSLSDDEIAQMQSRLKGRGDGVSADDLLALAAAFETAVAAVSTDPVAISAVDQKLGDLADALAACIGANPSWQHLGTALWALAKTEDPKYQPVYDEILVRHMDGDPTVLFQALVALDNFGAIERSYEVMSILAVEENRRTALAYLRRRGK
jgi:hypothetical protein